MGSTIESFENRDDFFRKITTYQNYWNLARLNFYKGGKKGIPPLEALTESAPDISPEVLLLPPVDLDNLFTSRVGHDVPELAVRRLQDVSYPVDYEIILVDDGSWDHVSSVTPLPSKFAMVKTEIV